MLWTLGIFRSMPPSEVRLWRGRRRHGQCECRHRKGLWEGSNKGEGIKGLSRFNPELFGSAGQREPTLGRCRHGEALLLFQGWLFNFYLAMQNHHTLHFLFLTWRASIMQEMYGELRNHLCNPCSALHFPPPLVPARAIGQQ